MHSRSTGAWPNVRAAIGAAVSSPSLVWLLVMTWTVAVLAVRRVAEADIWYHLANARQILERRAVPRVDLYTFTAGGTPVIDFEWLSELVYYGAFKGWGQRGLIVVYVILIVASYAGIYVLARKRGGRRVETALLTIVGVVLGSYSFGPRMMHFGWLCLVALMVLLERVEEDPKAAWLLPPLFALWINLHGSWLFGVVVLGATLIDRLVSFELGVVRSSRATDEHRRRLTLAAIFSIAALFVNPYGWELIRYPFDLRYRQASALAVIVEWRSVDFHDGYGKLALLMIVGLVMTAWLAREAWRLRDALLVLFSLWASLTYVRFLGFAAFILVPILAPRLRMMVPRSERGGHRVRNVVLALLMIVAIARVIPSNDTVDAHIARQFPRAALAFMEQRRITGPIFNAYDFGGYVTWHAPEIKTFADGRTDIFVYHGILQDYLKIASLEGTLDLLDRYGIEYVLYPPSTALAYLLENSPAWQAVYRDTAATLFMRSGNKPS